MAEILQLSELASQQIALLGYIQLDGNTLYVKEKYHADPLSLVPEESITTMSALNHNRSIFYVLTTDQNKAQRV